MRKLTSLMLGLSLACGVASVFAQDAPKDDSAKTEKTKKKKHKKSKKDDTKKDDTAAPQQ
ncbi:MAG TPA: hypothetical protein VHD76_00695 [Bryobacteraceae bacterium]|nr:hypothetical protein [Bryobacteraceae bacterium]